MTSLIPWYITAIVVAADLFIAGAVWHLLANAASRSGLPDLSARRVRIGTAVVLFGWLGAALLLAPFAESLTPQDSASLTPLIPMFGIGFALIALVALRLSPAFRRTLGAVSLPGVHAVQVYRLIGGVFVVLLALGQLPAHFALPAGWGDVAVGLAAPLVGLALARRLIGSRGLAAGWNLFGLVDLGVAVGMGTGYLAPLLLPELGPRVPPAAAMGAFPLILVPTFAVPLSIMLHVLGLARLAGEVRTGMPGLVTSA
jgi:hypothetical protein